MGTQKTNTPTGGNTGVRPPHVPISKAPIRITPFSQLRAARLKLSERKELNNGTLEWGHRKPTHQQAQQQTCVAGTCTRLHNPHKQSAMHMHQPPILSLFGKWNNGTLEWGHITPTHQQAATQVRCSGRKDLGAEAAVLDASGSVGCDSGSSAMSIQQWNSRKNVGCCL